MGYVLRAGERHPVCTCLQNSRLREAKGLPETTPEAPVAPPCPPAAGSAPCVTPSYTRVGLGGRKPSEVLDRDGHVMRTRGSSQQPREGA